MFGMTYHRGNENFINNKLDLDVNQLKVTALLQTMMSTMSMMSDMIRIDTMIDTIITLNHSASIISILS